MRRRKMNWRNAAYEYIKENGPSTSEKLLSAMKTKRVHCGAEAIKAQRILMPHHNC